MIEPGFPMIPTKGSHDPYLRQLW